MRNGQGKLHLSHGVWKRCRAVKQNGYGVEHCDINGSHAMGDLGVALAGGGVIERVRNGKVERAHVIAGTDFYIVSGGSRVQFFSMTGKNLGAQNVRRGKVPMIPKDLLVPQPYTDTSFNPVKPEGLLDYKHVPGEFPGVARLLGYESDLDSWFGIPWEERRAELDRAIVEVLGEVDSLGLGRVGAWHGWSYSNSAFGWTRFATDEDDRRIIHLAENLNEYREPRSVLVTMIHEAAHSILEWGVGHKRPWRDVFVKLLSHFGVESEASVSASHTERESAELALIRPDGSPAPRPEKLKRFMAVCPNDFSHTVFSDRLPVSRPVCHEGGCAQASVPVERSWFRNPAHTD